MTLIDTILVELAYLDTLRKLDLFKTLSGILRPNLLIHLLQEVHAWTLLASLTFLSLWNEIALIVQKFRDLRPCAIYYDLRQIVLMQFVWIYSAIVLLYWSDLLLSDKIRLSYCTISIQLVRPIFALILR